jgi:hypothetical protein
MSLSVSPTVCLSSISHRVCPPLFFAEASTERLSIFAAIWLIVTMANFFAILQLGLVGI